MKNLHILVLLSMTQVPIFSSKSLFCQLASYQWASTFCMVQAGMHVLAHTCVEYCVQCGTDRSAML